MTGLWLATLLVGADPGFAVHVASSADVAPRTALAVADRLEARLQARLGRPGVVSLSEWGDCPRDCAGDVRRRTGAGTVVLLRLVGGVTRVRVVAERFEAGPRAITRSVVDLEADADDDWDVGLDAVAVDLWPDAPPPPDTHPALTSAGPAPATTRWAPWVTTAAGAAAVGVGVGFGVSSRDAGRTLESTVLDATTRDELEGRQRTHGLLANTLIVTGGVAVVGGLLWAWLGGDDAPPP